MSEMLKIIIRRHLALVLLGILYSPFVLLGQDACFTIHDMLDGGVANRVAVARSGSFFALDGVVTQIANGLPRVALPSALNITNSLYLLLPPFTAFIVNFIGVHAVAFVGLYRFLRRDAAVEPDWICSGISALYGTLPFYTTDSLSVAGLPWVASAFCGLAARKWRKTDTLVMAAFPFVSSLAISGLYVMISGVILAMALAVRRRVMPWPLVAGLVIMAIGYLVAEYQLVFAIISKAFTSHRTEFNPHYTSFDFTLALNASVRQFAFGHEHAPSLHLPLLVIAPLSAVIAAARGETQVSRRILAGLMLTSAFSLIYGFQYHLKVNELRESIAGLRQIQIGRFINWQPFLWYAIGACAIASLSRISFGRMRVGPWLAGSAFVVVGTYALAANHEITSSWRVACGDERAIFRNAARFSAWFAEPLFERLRKELGEPASNYRVGSIGLPPDVAIYNGFYTLDFYSSNYPREYKHHFRRIIARELEKAPRLRGNFDGWGSRCYIFSSELLNHLQTRESTSVIQNLELDMAVFSEMGGRYLLSGVPILNAQSLGLRLIGTWEDERALWRVHVYELKVEEQAPDPSA